MDDVERMYRHLVRTIRGNAPQLLTQPFQVADLYATILPYRLHRRDLPGTPDIVLSKYQTVIYVHGCFWHRHAGCRYATTPGTNRKFWASKFAANLSRDRRTLAAIRRLGWHPLVIWECETADERRLTRKLAKIREL